MSIKLTPSAPVTLPAPEARPDASIVIYDGQCRFCRAQVERLHRLDTRGTLAFLSLHDPAVMRRWPDLSHDDLMQQMYVIDPQGGRHAGAESLRYLSRRLPRLRWLSPLLGIPFSMPLWRFLYRHVARRRYWFGRVQTCEDGACSLH